MIIDFHAHLGDAQTPNGGELIFRKGVKKQRVLDLITVTEWRKYKTVPVVEWVVKTLFTNQIARAGQARSLAATLENFKKSMDENLIEKSVCLPIAPYVTFAEVKKAAEADSGVVPFTSVDFSLDSDLQSVLDQDVMDGAKGLKLHPIVQKEPLYGVKTFNAVEAFAVHNLPVLFHSGIFSYYLGREKKTMQRPECGDPRDALKICTAFPKVSFIAGHAGLFQYRQTIDSLSGLENVYVDTSFQSPKHIKELVKAFGPERVMYASDWPWGDRRASLRSLAEACRGDKSLWSGYSTSKMHRGSLVCNSESRNWGHTDALTNM